MADSKVVTTRKGFLKKRVMTAFKHAAKFDASKFDKKFEDEDNTYVARRFPRRHARALPAFASYAARRRRSRRRRRRCRRHHYRCCRHCSSPATTRLGVYSVHSVRSVRSVRTCRPGGKSSGGVRACTCVRARTRGTTISTAASAHPPPHTSSR